MTALIDHSIFKIDQTARTVRLHGSLANEFGDVARIAASTPREVFRALMVTRPGFEEALRAGHFQIVLGDVETGLGIDESNIDLSISAKRELHIIPVVEGGKKSGIGKVLAGVALVGLAVVTGGSALMATSVVAGMSVGGMVAMTGVGMMLGGLAQMLAPTPQLGDYSDREEERVSYLSNGVVNTSQEGGPIPIALGGPILVGSHVASSGLDVDEIDFGTGGNKPNPTPPPIGGGGPWSFLHDVVNPDSDYNKWLRDQYNNQENAGVVGAKGGKGGGKARAAREAPNTVASEAVARVLDLVSSGEIEGWDDPEHPFRNVYLDETVVENPDGTRNFSGLEMDYRSGAPAQDYIAGFPQTENPTGVGVEVTRSQPVTRQIASDPGNGLVVDRVKVILRFPALTQADTSNGDINGARVSYRIGIIPNGGSPQWIVNHTLEEKFDSPFQKAHTLALPEDGHPYAIRVERLTPDSTSLTLQNEIWWDAYVEMIDAKLSYSGCAMVGLTAYARQFGDRIPSRGYLIKGAICEVPSNYDPINRTYSGIWDGTFVRLWTNNPAWILWTCLTNQDWGLGKRIPRSFVDKWGLYEISQRCDEYLSDGLELPNKFNLTASQNAVRKASVRVASREPTALSSNVVDGIALKSGDRVLLTGQGGNADNGIFTWNGSQLVRAADADSPAELEYALVRVTEGSKKGRNYLQVNSQQDYDSDGGVWVSVHPRFEFNMWINSREQVYKAMQTIAQSFRGMLIWGRGMVMATQDAPKSPKRLITNANVHGGAFVYEGLGLKSQHSVALVTWVNPDDKWKPNVEVVENPELYAKLEWKPVDVFAAGCTNRAQARRMGLWTLYTEQYESELVTFKGSFEVADVVPGDILQIADNDQIGIRMAGRVIDAPKPSAQSTVKIDMEFDFKEDVDYRIYLTGEDGTVYVRDVVNAPGVTDVVTFTPAITSNYPLTGKDSVFIITSSEVDPRLFRVMGVSEHADNEIEINCSEYYPEKFPMVEAGESFEPRQSTIFDSSVLPAPPTDIDIRRLTIMTPTGPREDLEVVFQRSSSVLVSEYLVRWRYRMGAWNETRTVTTSARFPFQGEGQYDIIISGRDVRGQETVPVSFSKTFAAERPINLSTVGNLRIKGEDASVTTFSGDVLRLEWDVTPPEGYDAAWRDPFFKDFEVTVDDSAGAPLASFTTTSAYFELSSEAYSEITAAAQSRSIRISVRLRDSHGSVSDPVSGTFVNPAPPVPSIQTRASITGITIQFEGSKPSDFSENCIWVGESESVNTNREPDYYTSQNVLEITTGAATTRWFVVGRTDTWSSSRRDCLKSAAIKGDSLIQDPQLIAGNVINIGDKSVTQFMEMVEGLEEIYEDTTGAAESAAAAAHSASQAIAAKAAAIIARGEAQTARQEAEDAAVAAALNASNAGTSASAADTARSLAETAKTLAETAKSDAQQAVSAAEGARQAALEQAALAAGSATTAAGHATTASSKADAAAGSATAAAGSATVASTAAGEASTSASNAASSATTAEGHSSSASLSAEAAAESKLAAGNSASAAAGSASTAASKATDAGNSASAASESAVAAASSFNATNLSRAALFPERYETTGQYFTGTVAGSPESVPDRPSNATAAGFGPVYETTTSSATTDWASRGVLPATPGRIYEIEIELQRTAFTGTPNASTRFYPNVRQLTASYGNNSPTYRSASAVVLDGTVQKSSFRVSDVANPAANVLDWAPGTVWLRPYGRVDLGGASSITVQFRRLRVTDVTESVNAGNSANAAATSASAASTSATNAGNSATAAESSSVSARSSYTGAALAAAAAMPETIGAAWLTTSGEGNPSTRSDAPGVYGEITNGVWTSDVGESAYATFKSVVPWSAGKIYEIAIEVEAVAATGGTTAASGYARVLRSDYNAVSGANEAYNWTNVTVGQRTVITRRYGMGITPAGGTLIPNVNSDAAFVRFGALFNFGGAANRQTKLHRISVRDVTALVNAEQQASAAATSASAASTSATDAGNAATAAASSAVSAQSAYNSVVLAGGNQGFEEGITGWSQLGSANTIATWGSVQSSYKDQSQVYVTNPAARAQIWALKRWPVDMSRRYRVRGRFYAGDGGATREYVGISCLDANGNFIGDNSGLQYIPGSGAVRPANTGWVELSADITGESTSATGSSWNAIDNVGKFRLGTKFIQLIALLNFDQTAGARAGLDGVWIEDVTESANAAQHASAAATSASAASTSATNAGNSATAAQSSAVSATSSYEAARLTASTVLPSTFDQDGEFWTWNTTGNPATAPSVTTGGTYNVSFPVVDGSKVIQYTTTSGQLNLGTRNVMRLVSGRRMKLTVEARVTTGTAAGYLYVYANNAEYQFSNGSEGGAVNLTNQWQTFVREATGDTMMGSGAVYGRGVFRAMDSGKTYQVRRIHLEDITESYNAGQSANAAASSASSASTSANNAGQSASAASSAKTAAETAKGAAETAASNASSSATTAAGHASNASTSAGAAATSAQNAGNSATAASGHANTAGTKATEAGNSATAAAASAVSASSSYTATRDTAVSIWPDRFNGDYWTGSAGGSPSSVPAVTGGTIVEGVRGTAYQVGPNSTTFYVLHRNVFLRSDSVYEVEADIEVIERGTGWNPYVRTYIRGQDASHAYIVANSAAIVYVPSTGRYTVKGRFSGASLTGVTQLNSSVVYARPGLQFVNFGDTVAQIFSIAVRDVTSQVAAEQQASAAASSASSASTSATNAGQSASAAQTAKTAAETAAGSASTHATNASNSATNAAGSASAASTSAGVAASSRDAAQSYATGNLIGKPTFNDGSRGNWLSGTVVANTGPNGQHTHVLQHPNGTDLRFGEYRADIRGGRHIRCQGWAYRPSGASGVGVGIFGRNSSGSAAHSYDTIDSALTIGQWKQFDVTMVLTSTMVEGQPFVRQSGTSTPVLWTDLIWTDVTESRLAAQEASAAATSASNASTSATNAGNSATAAAASAVSASSSYNATRVTSASVFPEDFSNEGATWLGNAWEGSPANMTGLTISSSHAFYSFPTVSGVGKILEVFNSGANNVDVATLGVFTPVVGRRYRITTRSRVTVDAPGGTSGPRVAIYYLMLDSGYIYTNASSGSWEVTTSQGWLEHSLERTGDQLLGMSGAGVICRPMVRFYAYGVNNTYQLQYLRFEDITESYNAGQSASAAASSASSASTSANNAGQSASAASSAKTAAETAKGAAETAASNASSSASTAAGHASNASTSATNAANSATAAGNSASAASGSASTAGTHATNAGNSATAANSAKVAAESAYTSTVIAGGNNDLSEGLIGWHRNITGGALVSSTTWASSFEGKSGVAVVPVGTRADFFTAKRFPVDPSRKYRVRIRFWVGPGTGSVRVYHGIRAVDAAGNVTHSNNQYQSSSYHPAGSGWVEHPGFIITGVGESSSAFYPGTTDVSLMAYLNYDANNNIQTALDGIWLEDVTESENAAQQASAAATSASTASTKAGEAGSSASAAAQSATQASTHASNASTYASNASTSAGNAASSASTAGTHASNASGHASTAQSAASTATGAAQAAQLSASIAASTGNRALNKNANFNDWGSSTTGVPPEWSNGMGAVASTARRVTGEVAQYALQLDGPAGGDCYVVQNGDVGSLSQNQYFVVEGHVRLESGTLVGSGILFRERQGTASRYDHVISFATTPYNNTGSAIGNGVAGRTYRFASLVRALNSTADNWQLYAMAHWTAHGSNASANRLTWFLCSVRPATTEEIEVGKANTGPGLSARIQAVETVTTDGTFATAQSVSTLSTTVGGHTSSIQSLNSLTSTHTSTLATMRQLSVVGNRVTGWQSTNDGVKTSFDIQADKFRLTSSNGATAAQPFTVDATTGHVYASGMTIRNAASGERTETRPTGVYVFNSAGVAVVELGVLL